MAEPTPALRIPDPHPWDRSIQTLFRGHAIWHYTNLDGLVGVLKSRTLWASSAATLNDSTEMTYGMELAEEVLEAWSKNHPLTGPEHKFLLKSMNTASKMLHADQVMVACASTEEDDPFQWRFYAEDGRGYAIGLRAAWMGGMLDNSKRPRVQTVLGRPMWGRVVYSRPYQQQLVEEVIERALLEFREAEDESVRGWLVGGTAQTLADVIAHMKHEGFRGENEVRLVQSVSNTSHAGSLSG